MGAALIFPLAAVVLLVAIWIAFGARKTRQQARADESLPADPYARRKEEVTRLRRDHEEADPSLTRHPARRP
jgi:hypothetical protein